MTDREALRTMLIYAQHEAEQLQLHSVAEAISQAVAGFETLHADRAFARGEGRMHVDLGPETEFHSHFQTRRLQ